MYLHPTHGSTLRHEGLENQLQVLRDAYQAALFDSDDGITVGAYACANCYHLLSARAVVGVAGASSVRRTYDENSCNCVKPLSWPIDAVMQKLSLELGRCDPHLEDGR